MLELREQELIDAPIVSHNAISPYYSLEVRAILITELIQHRNLKAEYLAVRIRK
jgi:hypothetical protein